MIGEYGINPSEYWKMTMPEVMNIVELKRPKTVNGMDEEDFYDMLERRDIMIDNGEEVL